MAPIRTVLLADDHPLVLEALRRLVEAQPGLRVVAACRDGRTALEELRRLRPDLAVVDVSMPRVTGLELLAGAAREGLGTRIALITAAMGDEDLAAVAVSDAAALMFKDWPPERIADCLKRVLAGGRCLPTSLIETVHARAAERPGGRPHFAARLTAREQQMVAGVAAGLTNKEIARDLGLKEGTVKVHLHNVYEKLAVRSRTELVKLALARGGSGRRGAPSQ
jgi:two-component system, NarL family, nitrate/nitrite response regulator NarL